MSLYVNIRTEWLHENKKYIDMLFENCGIKHNGYQYYNCSPDTIYDSIYIHLSNHYKGSDLLDRTTLSAISILIEDFCEIWNYDEKKFSKLYCLYETIIENN